MCCRLRTLIDDLLLSDIMIQSAPKTIGHDPTRFPRRENGVSSSGRKEVHMAANTALLHVKVAPKGMGLNDFVAFEEGYYADEGVDVELDWKTFRGTQSSWKNYQYFQRPQDQPYTENK